MIKLDDLLRPDQIRVAGVFFDALFSLDKFIAFEQRDPFVDRQKRDDPFDNEWDRFAAAEYQRLALEEEAREADVIIVVFTPEYKERFTKWLLMEAKLIHELAEKGTQVYVFDSECMRPSDIRVNLMVISEWLAW